MPIQETSEMTINNLQLPTKLQISLRTGAWVRPGESYSGRWVDPSKIELFKKIFSNVKNPIPMLYSFELMKEVNEMWSNPGFVDEFFGAFSESHSPGNIDPARTLIIGESEPESPIALDYRTPVPRIIYFCDIGAQTFWVEAVESVDVFLETFGLS